MDRNNIVLTTVFNYITYGLPPFSLKAPIKVSGDYWGKNSGELELIVADNELVCGVIDKAEFGKYGLYTLSRSCMYLRWLVVCSPFSADSSLAIFRLNLKTGEQ